MKTIVIGDIHGRDTWKEIIKQPHDQVVFLGDYFDTHENILPVDQISNFNQILRFAALNRDKVVLLLGNHDFHYMGFCNDRYSGYNAEYEVIIGLAPKAAYSSKLLRIAHSVGNYVMSHAGFTKTWCLNNRADLNNLVDSVNQMFNRYPENFKFEDEDITGYGDDPRQGPLWVRPDTLMTDGIDGVTQIVGHTVMKWCWDCNMKDRGRRLIFIDCLGYSGEYLELEDGHYKTANINKNGK